MRRRISVRLGRLLVYCGPQVCRGLKHSSVGICAFRCAFGFMRCHSCEADGAIGLSRRMAERLGVVPAGRSA